MDPQKNNNECKLQNTKETLKGHRARPTETRGISVQKQARYRQWKVIILSKAIRIRKRVSLQTGQTVPSEKETGKRGESLNASKSRFGATAKKKGGLRPRYSNLLVENLERGQAGRGVDRRKEARRKEHTPPHPQHPAAPTRRHKRKNPSGRENYTCFVNEEQTPSL